MTVFYPGSVKPFVRVSAPFHSKQEAATFEIELMPKMSFGTGHHATTYLMLEQMGQLDFEGKEVIDFGTGTAVLAILAEKLGAATVLAIDNDDWSIANANENILANNCSRITIEKAETIPDGKKAGIILANINLNIIISNLHTIKNSCMAGATILFSGILKQDEKKILDHIAQNGLTASIVLYKQDWLLIRVNV